MTSRPKIKLLVFLLFLSQAYTFDFEDAGEEGVLLGTIGGATQIVDVDENNNGSSVTIVKIVNVQSTLRLQIQSGLENGLNPTLEPIDDTSYYLKGVRLDYEKLTNPQILLIITDGDDAATQKILSVRIINLDDEPPYLTVSSCEMEENNHYTVDTTPCIFRVGDPDGWLQFMTFDILGSSNEDDTFEFVYDVQPDNYTYETNLYLVLKDGVELDYEQVTLYTFVVQAMDDAKHNTAPPNITVIVQVIDMPDMPPVWLKFPYAARIDEKTESTLEVSARDGDFGINNEINYRIDVESVAKNISIDIEKGTITILYIDRDSKDYDNNQVTVIVTAYEKVDETSTLTDSITLLVNDLDDQIPLITPSENAKPDVRPDGCDAQTIISITEDPKSVTINICERATEIANLDIIAEDIDLGENAMYTAVLNSDGFDFSPGFQIIPGRGYEQSTLTLTITDPSLIDFEDPDWKNINIELYTQGTLLATNNDTLPIIINLIDWNDESPIFSQTEYTVAILESIPIGTTVAVIQATDRDAEDFELAHEIVGTFAQSIVEIPSIGGNITTILDKSFDHEKQDEVYIQIRATDKVGHTATALLAVTVIDVNDKDPRLVVSSVVEIEENQVDGTPLDVTISATDDDGTADLHFFILWEDSYATKNSMPISATLFSPYIGCVTVETNPGATNHIAYASLTIRETVKDNTPDFEKFDTLFLMLLVVDNGTEIGTGTDSSLVVINVKDVNDNPPDLSANEGKTWRVMENSANNTQIGSITYNDPDTVGEVSLSIEPTDADTPRWVSIDRTAGTLYVDIQELGGVLDCDDPKRDNLKYTIFANDTVFQTSIDITIDITDENENTPELDETITVNIDEDFGDNATSDGKQVTLLIANDIDRDEPYHTVRCAFQTPSTPQSVSSRFNIINNLELVVELAAGLNLDREKEPSYTFQLNCFDDPERTGSRRNTATPPPTVTIVLNDINDNVPIVTTTSGFTFSEIDAKGKSVTIVGKDDDEGDNGLIDFTLTKIQRFSDASHQTSIDVPQDLFSLETEDSLKSAILSVAAENLNDYFGYYLLTIDTTDRGTPESLSKEDNIVEVEVSPYNFKEIVFVFPVEGTTYYISPDQNEDMTVMLYNNEYLSVLSANDNGQNKYRITYTLYDENNIFKSSGVNIQMASTNFDPDATYTVTVKASLDTSTLPQTGEAAYEKNCTIKFQFFAQNTAEPAFQTHADSASIEENDPSFEYQLGPINYPDVNIPDLPKYYLMSEGDRTLFALDINTGLITLTDPLDYEVQTVYVLIIQASSTQNLKQDAPDSTKFTLTVNVIDVNDNAPVFGAKENYGTIVTNTQANTVILTVSATDVDTTSQDKLRFFIDDTKGSTQQLNSLPQPFQIDTVTGIITSAAVIPDGYKGYFNLSLRVMDEAPENFNDTANAQIYIVSEDNTVNFKFQNVLEDVRNKTSIITRILDDEFKYLSHVHNPSTTDDATMTLTPIYFIDDNVPVEAASILARVTNTAEFQKLSNLFKEELLFLVNFQTSSDSNNNMEEVFKAWLIGISVVLGGLCIILAIAFILKTRSLNQRITKLSNTKFGSQESGLNRAGVTAPTTNKHALEGSNPVYNNEVSEKDLDRTSVTSGDSDLIGIENDDKFDYAYANKID